MPSTRMRWLLLRLSGLLISACTAPGDTASSVLPDTFYVEAAQNPFDERLHAESGRDYVATFGFEWYLSPRPMAVVSMPAPDIPAPPAPHPWAVWKDAPAAPDGSVTFTADDDGLNVKLPAAALSAALVAVLGFFGYRRHRRNGHETPTKES